MKKYDIVFLILNYHSSDELDECVQSIDLNCAGCEYGIVIVDNGSGDDEVDKLKRLYGNRINITIILSEKNLGFARGNNLGFRYIKNNILTKYIAMINSDVVLLDNSFYSQIDAAFREYGFAVMGPDILYSHNNPMINEPDTKDKVVKEIIKVKRIKTIIGIPGLNYAYLIFNKLRNKLVAKRVAVTKIEFDCALHGCCLIFSENYMADGLCDKTFLYGEEAILAKECRDAKQLLMYNPKIQILHNESVATKRNVPDLIKRKKFYLENYLDSLEILLSKYE